VSSASSKSSSSTRAIAPSERTTSSQISDDPNGPVTIFPSSRADARAMAQRVKRRTGRDVVVADGYPGLEEPTAGAPIVPLTGDSKVDAQAAGVGSTTGSSESSVTK
jgi:hypothetical protein